MVECVKRLPPRQAWGLPPIPATGDKRTRLPRFGRVDLLLARLQVVANPQLRGSSQT